MFMDKRQQQEVARAIETLAATVRGFPAALSASNSAFEALFVYLGTTLNRVHAEQTSSTTTAEIVRAHDQTLAMLDGLINGFHEANKPALDGAYTELISAKITQPLGRVYYGLDAVNKAAPTRESKETSQALAGQAMTLPPITVRAAVELVKTSLNSFVLLTLAATSDFAAVWSKSKKALAGVLSDSDTETRATHTLFSASSVEAHHCSLSAPVPVPPAPTDNKSGVGFVTRATTTRVPTAPATASTSPPGTRPKTESGTAAVTRLMKAIESTIWAFEQTVSRALDGYAALAHALVVPTAVPDIGSLLSTTSGSVATQSEVVDDDSITTLPHADARCGTASRVSSQAMRRNKITNAATPSHFVDLADQLASDCAKVLSPARFNYTGLMVREKVQQPLLQMQKECDSVVRKIRAASEKTKKVTPHISAALAEREKQYLTHFYAELRTATSALVAIQSESVTYMLALLKPYVF